MITDMMGLLDTLGRAIHETWSTMDWDQLSEVEKEDEKQCALSLIRAFCEDAGLTHPNWELRAPSACACLRALAAYRVDDRGNEE